MSKKNAAKKNAAKKIQNFFRIYLLKQRLKLLDKCHHKKMLRSKIHVVLYCIFVQPAINSLIDDILSLTEVIFS